MNDPAKQYGTLVSLFLMLATIAGGYVSLRKSPQANRPAPDHASRPALVGENADASRLWEDPFWTLTNLKDKSDHSAAQYQPDRLRSSIEQRLAQGKSLLVLPVLIEGTPFPEDVEVRLRMRYAVQMALAAQGYTPENRTRIELAIFPWPRATEDLALKSQTRATNATPRQLWVPYEWFVVNGNNTSASRHDTLVLWLPEEHVADFPISRIEKLLAKIHPRDVATPATFTERTSVAVIGPRSSNTLKSFLENIARTPAFEELPSVNLDSSNEANTKSPWGKLQLYSSQATAADWFLLPPSKSSDPPPREAIRETLKSKLDFYHLGTTDNQLTDLLIEELQRRGLDPTQSQNGDIALICEADTTYGRALPLTFLDSVLRAQTNSASQSNAPAHQRVLDNSRFQQAPNIRVFRYLRGLDGHRGESAKTRDSAELSLSPEKTLLQTLQPRGERSEGESQYDYIENLARSLARLNQNRIAAGHNRVRAIGIMGSDVYDKLILLQALHLQLPEMIFFTTDLDRRFWNPDRYPFTRNLIVASGHPLVPLSDSTQHAFDLADFRDSYQVGVYQSCLAALRHTTHRTNSIEPFQARPALFEIGRRTAVPLTPSTTPENPFLGFVPRTVIGLLLIAASAAFVALRNPDVRQFLNLACKSHPAPSQLNPSEIQRASKAPSNRNSDAAEPTSASSVPDASAEPLAVTLENTISQHHRAILYTVILSMIAAIIGLLACGEISTWPGEEPWSFKESVSIWPTQIVRLATIAAMALTLVHAHFRNKADSIRLNLAYFKGQCRSKATTTGRSGREEWLHLVGSPQQPAPTRAHAIFNSYLQLSSSSVRYFRVTALAFVFAGAAFGLVTFFGGVPERPFIRGEFSRLIDNFFLWSTLIVFTFLVAYVTDAVRLTSLVLRRIAQDAPSHWPTIPKLTPPAAAQLSRDQLDGWLDVLFARDLTAGVSKLLPLPFVSLLLLMLACNDHFDDWNWPPRLLFLVALCLSLAIACVAWLRASARYVRSNALRQLDRHSEVARNPLSTVNAPAASPSSPLPPPQVENRLAQLRKKIEEINDGAYARLLQDPSLLAVLLPTGGLGMITVLLQYLF